MRDGVTRSGFGSLFAGIAWPLTPQSLTPWPEWGVGLLGYHGPSGRFVWALSYPRLRLGLRGAWGLRARGLPNAGSWVEGMKSWGTAKGARNGSSACSAGCEWKVESGKWGGSACSGDARWRHAVRVWLPIRWHRLAPDPLAGIDGRLGCTKGGSRPFRPYCSGAELPKAAPWA